MARRASLLEGRDRNLRGPGSTSTSRTRVTRGAPAGLAARGLWRGESTAMTRGQRWMVAAVVLGGAAAGLGLYTFGYARGYAYMTNDPAACANCHIMAEHYGAWMKGSHHAVATCNYCHTPHNLAGKYLVKARNGFWHSFYFTTGNFPDPLRITERNREVTEHACS